ncbi:MAG: hypothetical protein E7352_02840 [Clostridiales bacterium]|nr:hypothetical protein [Clostridiales bacterium]
MENYLLYEIADNGSSAFEQRETETVRFGKLRPFSKKGKGRLSNLYWWLISKKLYICEIADKETGEVMHYTYVMKKSYKFPFMKKDDYMVGPSVTDEKFRGRGLLGRGINFAKQEILAINANARFIGLVRQKNISSRKGIEKIGMLSTGREFRKNRLKIYKEVKEEKTEE